MNIFCHDIIPFCFLALIDATQTINFQPTSNMRKSIAFAWILAFFFFFSE